MLGDEEHPISFLFEPRVEGAHVKVRVRTGLRGVRALAGELTFRPEEWAAFREATGRSVEDADEARRVRELVSVTPLRELAVSELVARLAARDAWTRGVLLANAGALRVVHLDLDPVEFGEVEGG